MAAAEYPSDIIDTRDNIDIIDTRDTTDVFHPVLFQLMKITAAEFDVLPRQGSLSNSN